MQVVYAKYTTWISPSVQIVEGEAWRADDPVVAKHPEKFDSLPKVIRTTLPRHLRGEPVVEQATAAPGERRATRRPAARKKAADSSSEADGGSQNERASADDGQ